MKIAKLTSIAFIALISTTAPAVFAADETSPAGMGMQPQKNNMQPHSHVQEKHGMQMKSNANGKSEKPDNQANPASPAKEKSRHFHPRDGK